MPAQAATAAKMPHAYVTFAVCRFTIFQRSGRRTRLDLSQGSSPTLDP